MKVVDLHPEDLLDREARGDLGEADRARLEAHLARCATCRAERRLRADFAEELAGEHSLSASEIVALVEGSKASPPRASRPDVTPAPVPDAPESDRAPEPRRSSRPRRKAGVWMLVAAALLVGGVAGAGVGVRTWTRVRSNALETTVPARGPGDAPLPPSQAKKGPTAIAPATTLVAPAPIEEAPSLAEATPASVATALDAPPPSPARAPVSAPVQVSTTTTATPAPAACAQPEASKPETASALFDSANDARRRGDHTLAILQCRRLQTSFPQSREAHVSRATLGQLLLDRGDARGALASFDAYQAGGGGALDEAVMVGRANALDRLGRDADARAAWKALVDRFPGSPHARHAEARASGTKP